MTLTLRYFAWVRERVGAPSETVETAAATGADLGADLRGREARYGRASPTCAPSASPSIRSWPTSPPRSPAPARSRSSRR